MSEIIDIRDRPYLSGKEVKKLNFIRRTDRFVFRKYYRSGLRSHIFEVLATEDVEKETSGVKVDGVLTFPRAKPLKMFRILRHRFDDINAVFSEIQKYNMLLKWLGSELMATSEEFIVDYNETGESQIVLCGLQEYVGGDILDPWRLFDRDCLKDLFKTKGFTEEQIDTCFNQVLNNIRIFVRRIRIMIKDTGFIPDLAGNGNLIVTPQGCLKLVDINNIVRIQPDHIILIDDKGYPSCDVSVEVLSIFETIAQGKPVSLEDPLYRHFLEPGRKRMVKQLERDFYKKLKNGKEAPAPLKNLFSGCL